MKQIFLDNKLVFYFFIILSFVFYANSLKNKYALDDEYITVTNIPVKGKEFIPNNNTIAQGFKGIPKIWKSNYAQDDESNFEYRPVTTTSFAIEYGIFGQNPFISHLINILLYAGCVCLAFMVIFKLLENQNYQFHVAFVTAFLFLLHPVHTEVVNNLKCRDELLSFFFGMLALWFALKTAVKATSFFNIALVVLCLLLGILSKRSAMTFIGIIPLCLIFYRKIDIKKWAVFGVVVFLMLLFKRLIKSNLLVTESIRIYYHFENPLYLEPLSFFGNVIVGLKTCGFYIKLLFIPYPLRFYYGANIVDVSTDINIYFFVALIFLIGSAIYYFKTKNKLFLFSLFLFLGSILPFTNFYIPAPGVAAERFIFQASLGFLLLVVSTILPLFSNKTTFKITDVFQKPLLYISVIAFISLCYTWQRNSHWYNKLTLFEHDIAYTESSAKANSLLGNEYFETLAGGINQRKYTPQQLTQKALTCYNAAAAADSSIYTVYNNAGVVSFSFLQDYNLAVKYFKLAINHKKKYAQAYENLGNSYQKLNQLPLAYKAYIQAIESNHKQYSAYNEFIKLLLANKHYKQSESVSLAALSIFKNDYTFLIHLANSYLLNGDKEKSLPIFKKAYDVYPNDDLKKFIEAN